jgi:WD40 repeat protein
MQKIKRRRKESYCVVISVNFALLPFIRLQIWRLSDGSVLKEINHTEKITCLTCTKDSQYLVTGSQDRSVKVWEIDSGKIVQVNSNCYISSAHLCIVIFYALYWLYTVVPINTLSRFWWADFYFVFHETLNLYKINTNKHCIYSWNLTTTLSNELRTKLFHSCDCLLENPHVIIALCKRTISFI